MGRSKNDVICSKNCGVCDGGKEVAKINEDYVCNSCGEKYCSNAIKLENISKCVICNEGEVVKKD